ncbi:hypothetical protein QQP08_014325 [Theobroma cacao]|nr:hypothetical protein QQP08_014325 [Theobroma cacao]
MVVSVSSSGQMLEKGRPLVTSTDALAIGKRTENQEYGCCVTFLRLSSIYVCRVQIERRRMVGWIGGRENQIREARLSRQLKTWAKTPGL